MRRAIGKHRSRPRAINKHRARPLLGARGKKGQLCASDRPWIWIALHNLLPILAPAVAIIKDVNLTFGLHNNPRLRTALDAIAAMSMALVVVFAAVETSNFLKEIQRDTLELV